VTIANCANFFRLKTEISRIALSPISVNLLVGA